MHRNVLKVVALLGALALIVALAGSATAGNRPLVAVLRGANEVPGPGDADGSGVALIRRVSVDNGTDKVCWLIVTNRIALPATGAHIHLGAAGVAGPVQVTLGNPTKVPPVMGRGVGMSRGCTDPASAVPAYTDAQLDAIWANPKGFYVNVHNAVYPAGAIRGQLR